MTDHEPNNSHPVTKSELDKALAATERRTAQLVSTTKSDLEQLLAEQTNVILGAVDERLQAQKSDIVTLLDEKLDEKFDHVMTGLDAVMKEVQAHREEDVVGAEQLRRHDDQLQHHELRLKSLEFPA
jgi:hypothetical protein